MSELYKAMKRIEDYQSTKPLYKQIAEIKGIASTARYGYDFNPSSRFLKALRMSWKDLTQMKVKLKSQYLLKDIMSVSSQTN